MKNLLKLSSAGLMLILFALTSGCRLTPTRESGTGVVPPVAERVVGGLQEPVALAFLSGSILLVAEQHTGRIRWIERGTLRAEPFAIVPVAAGNARGLLGLAVDPDYPQRPYVYAFHTDPGTVVRFTVKDGKGVDPRAIIGDLPDVAGGGRLLFAPDGTLYLTMGGDAKQPEYAQDYARLAGKVLRYSADGSVPEDNPFVTEKQLQFDADVAEQTSPKPSPVFTIGHRDPRGIAVNPDTNELYLVECGPGRDDEIAHLLPGDNYGWPEASGRSADPRFHAPLWTTGERSIAPGGAAFYTGEAFPQFRGNLLFTAGKDGRLRRAIFNGPDAISGVEEIPEAGTNARGDVQVGPDGWIYYTSVDAVYRLVAKVDEAK